MFRLILKMKDMEIFIKNLKNKYKNYFNELKIVNNYENKETSEYIILRLSLYLREISINKALSLSYMKIEERGKVGFLFGAENSGLSNEEIVMSDYTFSIPVNQDFSSINLSHSVMIVCWEFYKKNIFGGVKINKARAKKVYNLATNSEKEYFFKKMNNMLQKSNFFHSKNMNNSIMKNMKTLFNRSSLTTQELKTLNGMIKSLFDYNNDT